MSYDFVKFNIRCETAQYELKIPTPVNAAEFMEELVGT